MQNKPQPITIILALVLMALFAYALLRQPSITAPAIAFLPAGASYQAKPDFAQLEYQHPIAFDQLVNI